MPFRSDQSRLESLKCDRSIGSGGIIVPKTAGFCLWQKLRVWIFTRVLTLLSSLNHRDVWSVVILTCELPPKTPPACLAHWRLWIWLRAWRFPHKIIMIKEYICGKWHEFVRIYLPIWWNETCRLHKIKVRKKSRHKFDYRIKVYLKLIRNMSKARKEEKFVWDSQRCLIELRISLLRKADVSEGENTSWEFRHIYLNL